VRGFIDDMTLIERWLLRFTSQSAFVRGFIDDGYSKIVSSPRMDVSIRVRARLHR